jgi:hypothetical protein
MESEWDDDERDMFAAADYVTRNTGRLGEWLPDALKPGADPNSYTGVHYLADGPHTNQAEKAERDALDAYKKSGENVNLNGVFFTVKEHDYGD